MKRKLSLVLAMVMILTSIFVTGASATGETVDAINAVDTVVDGNTALPELPSYAEYLSDKGGFSNATQEVIIDATDFVSSVNAEVEKLDTFKPQDGEERQTVVKWTNEEGYITYNFNVPADGLYTVKFLYSALPARNNAVGLGIKVDDKYFFENMKDFTLDRIFKDAPILETDEKGKEKYDKDGNPIYQVAVDKDGNPRTDVNGDPVYVTVRTDGIGNEFAAEQIEHFAFQEAYFTDATGLENFPYTFALTAGAHTLTIESKAEPVAFDAIVFGAPIEYKPYSEVSKEYDTSKKVSSGVIRIEGEDAKFKNANSLVAQYDQTDPSVSSANGSNPYLTRINYIGNVNWASPGQRLTWKVTVPEAGYYKLAYRYKQNHVLNGNSYRKLLINGKVPFEEASEIAFYYGLNWVHKEFADEDGNAYLIYFEKGENTIEMEVDLGELTKTVRDLKDVVYYVGNLYRDMVKVTGESPDNSRDYNLFEQIPQFNERLSEYSKELYRIAAETEELAGQLGGTNASTIRGLCEVLDEMVEHKWTAHQYKGRFYSNYTSVSALVYSMMEMGLNLDYIEIASPDDKFEDPAASWWKKTGYSIQRFFSSFSADYNNISGDIETEKTITIWANWGRDQIRVLNNLIQSSFTPETGIGVNLKMSSASYISAILSGKAPNCTLHMNRSDPVNLALRGAMVDLTQFSDYEKVIERFMTKDAMLPFTYDNDSTDDIPAGVYALPDTLNFYMLFYRTDIFEEYDLTPPKTWNEYLEIAALLNRNNLQASLPYAGIASATAVNAGVGALSILPTFIMQMGGEIYKEDYSGTLLTSTTSIEAFEFWTDFFNEYKFPVQADFFNRFRLGTMPMGIQNYSTYIQLTMAAPEITGKWKMVPIPGFEREDGTINNCQAGSGSGCGILKASKDYALGWEFLKWWTSADTQLAYSNNCESILGVSGRVATANPEALSKMGWDKESLKNLLEQWSNMKEVPEIPGSYYTARSIDQAYWNVVNNAQNAKDMLIKWAEISDAEIERKRNQYDVK